MHPHANQHGISPFLRQSFTILPAAPTNTLDSKFNHPRGTTGPSFAPVPAFHRATQKSFRPAKRGRWGALHVCIAWKIYDNQQLKRRLQKHNRLHPTLTPESPATSIPDTVLHQESHQFPCRYPDLDPPNGYSGKAAEHAGHPTSPSCRATKRGQSDSANDASLRDKCWGPAVAPERDVRLIGSFDRKRLHEPQSFPKVKRVKQEMACARFDSAKILHATPVQHGHATRTPEDFVPYPGAGRHPYQTASWEPLWDFHKRLEHHTLSDHSVNTCKLIGIPLVAQKMSTFAQHCHYPLALRQQAGHLRGVEFLPSHHQTRHLHHCRHQLPHPGFLTTSYLRP